MIDISAVRADPDAVRASQRARGEDDTVVDKLLAADHRRRVAATAYSNLRAQQKDLGARVAAAKSGRSTESADDVLAEASSVATKVKELEADQSVAEAETERLSRALSNLVDPRSPIGGEEDFTVLEHVGTPRDFVTEGLTARDHVELGQSLAAIDFERGVKVSGSRFYFLTGVGALLELALINRAVEQAVGAGFTPMIAPSLVRPEAMEGTGFLGQAAENVYRIESDDLYLVGTAEVPLAAYHSDEILDALPRRYVGWSPCYRREAGSHGRDVRGIFRVHWFDKVEMFCFVHPDQADDEHERLLQIEREYMDGLELPYRVIDVATGDLGSSAVRKFDIEAWIPSHGRYREVTSTSNCTQFQARRLGVRTRTPDGLIPVATLNGTLVAVPRIVVALLENHQQADGSVRVPVALQPYLGGRTELTPA